MAITNFARVRTILNNAMTAWANDPNNDPTNDPPNHLKRKHMPPNPSKFPNLYDQNFSRDDLVNGIARDTRLIQDGILPPLGQVGTQGNNANIIKVLRGTLPGFPRMPDGGPYISDPEIAEIVDWINHGAQP
jgi:hypothetical protein